MVSIQDAFFAILTQCDGASERDTVGFNAADASPARRLARRAESETWGAREDYAAWLMMAKYVKQLSNHGINYATIPAPPKPERNGSSRYVCRVADKPILRFAFEYGEKQFDAIKREIKESLGARWDAARKVWEMGYSQKTRDGILAVIDDYDFELSPGAIELLATEPGVIEPPKPARTITTSGSKWLVCWGKGDPAFSDLLTEIKGLPSRSYDSAKFGWLCPATAELLAICDEYDFTGRENLRAAVESQQAQADLNREASRAEDADLSAVGIDLNGFGVTPFPFQRAGIEYAVRNKRVLIGDEPGLGKTIQALGTIHALKSFPALVVCPASLKRNWERETARALPGKSISIWNGKEGATADVVIINYDNLKKQSEKLTGLNFQTVVFDESHYLKNHAAQRTEAAKTLAKNSPVRICLTGTPVLNRPQELLSQLGLLGRLDDMGGFWEFAKRYCNAHKTRFGWDFSGAANLTELNDKLRASCMVRRQKSQVLTELPAKQIARLAIELSNRKEYDRAERELIEWLRDRAASDAEFLKSIAHLEPQKQAQAKWSRSEEAANKAAQAEQLVRIEALKQLSAKGKLEAAKDWISSFLETGEKLVLFASHIEIQKTIAAEFPGCAMIFSEHSGDERQAAVDRFQNDPKCNLIVCSLGAAAEGITLTAASNVAFIEIGWNPGKMDQATDRVHRIGQTNQVTAWYLLGERTIDEEIAALIDVKRAVVDAATDGREDTSEFSIMNQLVQELLKTK